MTRLSRYFLPTTPRTPADAEAVSHLLLVRAGLARQVGAGLWTWLPAGWRAHRKVEQIIREELDAIGAPEMLMPVLQPAELWKQTGRYEIDELFKLQDRRDAELVLAMTHEEVVTFHVSREVRSYRDLPQLLYHFQIKERDEPRPRAGVLRTREFIMKDAYSLRPRRGRASSDSYELHIEAYDRIFDRSGLEWYRVESDVGMMGGIGAHEYMAPCAAGENDVALSDAGYAANVEIASGHAAAGRRAARRRCDAPEPVETPGAHHDRGRSRACSACRPGALIKALPGGRGGPRARAGARARRPPPERDQAAERARRAGAARRGGGGARPVRHRAGLHRPGRRAGRRWSPTRRCAACRACVTGANEPDTHLRGVEPGRDFEPELGRRAHASRPATATRSGADDPHRARDRGRQHLQARHALLGAARARRYLDEQGKEQPIVMGSYGIGPARIAGGRGRAVRRRARASPGRARSRPFDVELVDARQGGRGGARRSPTRLYDELRERRARRALRRPRRRAPGEKFADAELLGCPLRLTVGKRGARGGRARGPGPARPGEALAAARGRRRGGRGAVARAPLTLAARLLGLDRSGGPPPETRARRSRSTRGRSRTRSASSGSR